MSGVIAATSTSGRIPASLFNAHSIYARSEHYRSIQAGPHHLFAEPEQLGGAATGGLFEPPRRLEDAAILDQAAEILLVQAHAGERFHGALELEQRECLGQQLEHDRTVLQLAAQP